MKRINKLLITFILLTLCSGCSINYNLEIKEDTVTEYIEINDNTTPNRSKSDIITEYNRWFPAYIDDEDGAPTDYDSSIKTEGFEYHEKSIKELDNGYYYTYKYDYPLDKYQSATATREAYSKRKFYVDNDYIIINTDKTNLLCNYSYFDSLKVTITIDTDVYKLKDTNADERKGNTFIWNINRNNCNDSEIMLNLDTINNDTNDKENENPNNTDNKTLKNILDDYSLYIFLIILALIIYFGYKWFIKFKDKNNNID